LHNLYILNYYVNVEIVKDSRKMMFAIVLLLDKEFVLNPFVHPKTASPGMTHALRETTELYTVRKLAL
jgi:hypothetical protein